MVATEAVPTQDRYLRIADLLARYKVSRSTLWRNVKAGRFPSPVRLFDPSPTPFWRERDLLVWEAQRTATPAVEEARP